ncbi:DUF2007 domain-containing protein [Undibacterium pigrum]|uniref:Putative signal transducing protein n=1 Tax=Undibacterium pigrum TaxID=401470 RepID=A0A318IV08_9BURK|nr:DUF2007 domain-containing protein [Undibacterium pigrum]PXX37777.1 putative signal transducing protein [Undibacterium pigrum]
MSQSKDLITIATFLNPWDAHILRGLLESEDIPACLASEHQIWLNWQWSTALGGVDLRVPYAAQERAKEVLAQYMQGDYASALQEATEAEFGAADQPDTCPHCGSSDISYSNTNPGMLSAIGIYFFLGVIVPQPRKITCMACGHICKEKSLEDTGKN